MAALCVVLSHEAFFPFKALFPDATGLARAAIALHDMAFNGPAAVVVFFVISGLVIHYGQAGGAPLDTAAFLVRRIVRVLVPLLVTVAIAALLGPRQSGALHLVLWSLYCELIYYLLYPLLRRLFAAWGLRLCIALAFAVSLILLAIFHLDYHWQFPLVVLWIVPFPAWLIGCLLAEDAARSDKVGSPWIWAWRLGAWGYAWGALILFYHGPVKLGHPALLAPYPILVFFWLREELRHFRGRAPWPWLEWSGRWSYSLYLVHPIVLTTLPMALGGLVAGWGLRGVVVLAGAYVFYLLVESPAHRLARALSRKIAKA